MSDEIDIRGGGAVAVDTATLRSAADGFACLAVDLGEIAVAVGAAGSELASVSSAQDVSYALATVRLRTEAVIDDANALTAALRGAATVYDIVEARAERAAAEAAGDFAAVARIDARLAVLRLANPDAEGLATLSGFEHWLTWPAAVAAQAPGALWWLTPGMPALAFPVAWMLQRDIARRGAGTVAANAILTGRASAVALTPVPVRGPVAAPTSLAGAAGRIPGEGESRIRVEKYTMADGSRQFAVYVSGTQSFSRGTPEPFDMTSNIELYSGARSASYDATLTALEDAGAEKGDVVHAFGHSQGAMVAAHVALEGGFDTQTLVSFGSPVEADVGDGTLSIALRHADDPVVALTGGGHPGAVGAPGSFIAERVADPQAGLHDLRIPAHGIEGYTETARLVDSSGDARVGAVRELFEQLGDAASVDATEYRAERVTPVPPHRPDMLPAPGLLVNPSSWDAE